MIRFHKNVPAKLNEMGIYVKLGKYYLFEGNQMGTIDGFYHLRSVFLPTFYSICYRLVFSLLYAFIS